jgi:putative ABC transport system substrate-binding protein
MRESCMYGSERGARGNSRPYRTRRDFITLLGASAAWPLAARAQQPSQMRRIGIIMQMAEKDPQAQLNVLAFQKGLLARGLNVGQNLRIDYRFGATSVETIGTAVAEILATSPDVILAHGTAVTAVLQKQTQIVPVVFTVVSDPVGSGFIQSFARPGGNLTGFTNFLEPSMAAKWVELLKEIAPGVSRVAILFNPQLAAGGGMYFARPVEASAAALGVTTVRLPVQSPADIDQAINAFAQELGGGLIAPPDSTTLPHRDLILGIACLRSIRIACF